MNKCVRKCLIKQGFWALVAAGLVFAVTSAAFTPIVGAIVGVISLTIGMVQAIRACRKQCGID